MCSHPECPSCGTWSTGGKSLMTCLSMMSHCLVSAERSWTLTILWTLSWTFLPWLNPRTHRLPWWSIALQLRWAPLQAEPDLVSNTDWFQWGRWLWQCGEVASNAVVIDLVLNSTNSIKAAPNSLGSILICSATRIYNNLWWVWPNSSTAPLEHFQQPLEIILLIISKGHALIQNHETQYT